MTYVCCAHVNGQYVLHGYFESDDSESAACDCADVHELEDGDLVYVFAKCQTFRITALNRPRFKAVHVKEEKEKK